MLFLHACKKPHSHNIKERLALLASVDRVTKYLHLACLHIIYSFNKTIATKIPFDEMNENAMNKKRYQIAHGKLN